MNFHISLTKLYSGYKFEPALNVTWKCFLVDLFNSHFGTLTQTSCFVDEPANIRRPTDPYNGTFRYILSGVWVVERTDCN